MLKIITLFTLIFSISAIKNFELFKQKFNKNYKNQNIENYREDIFNYNLKKINRSNRLYNLGKRNYILDINSYTDLTNTEFINSYLQKQIYNNTETSLITTMNYVNSIKPSKMDWRDQNVVTKVKNQGMCGSCWAFSTIVSVESINAINTGKLVELSEQQLVDCSNKEGNMGCKGGLMDYGFQYIIDVGGVCSEDTYKYVGEDEKCNICCEKQIKIKSLTDVPENNEDALLEAVNKQPVSVAIQANTFAFRFYRSGVFDGRCGNPSDYQLDHGVGIVGYGVENDKMYWIVKNSWGSTWGDNGYIKILRTNSTNTPGHCGIAMNASYPNQ